MTVRRVLLLCGSPRPSGSNSAALLNGLRDRLDGRAETTLCRARARWRRRRPLAAGR